MDVFVINGKTFPTSLPGAHRVDCMRPSKLGNPHKLHSEVFRGVVIALFRSDMLKSLDTYDAILNAEIAKARAKGCTCIHLVCCCKPKPCHADSIAERMEHLLRLSTNP